jgi:hypothetical protein
LRDRVLVIGGYGVFGSRLARRLLQEADLDVVVAGRDLARATAFTAEWGGTPYALDRDNDQQLDRALAELAPRLLIDAAGPFQAYGPDALRVARKAVEAGAHYLDLADDRQFVVAIATLDGLAKARNLCAIAGASSVPALSGAAADVLTAGLRRPVIEAVIVPGNRAPRGLSLIRAILAQVGQPLRLWRGGRWSQASGWSGLQTVRLSAPGAAALGPRWASLIGAPDCDLFPQRYAASSVLFRAGLELRLLHGGLWLSGWLVRLKLIRSLIDFARPAQSIAERLRAMGTDRGGMAVSVAGRDAAGRAVRRRWTLIAEAGDGPSIPAMPAFAVTRKILSGAVASGARPCLGILTLEEAEAALAPLAVRTHRSERPAPPLFEQALGDGFDRLPAPVRDLHDVFDCRVFEGEASIERGRGAAAWCYATLAGFPPAGERVPVEVEMIRQGGHERWTRRFGRHVMRSRLGRRPADPPNVVWERFGCVSVEIVLRPADDGLAYPVRRGRLLGVPLPRLVVPTSQTRESVDDAGAVRFDIRVSLPSGGLIIRYAGTLRDETACGGL